MGFLEAGTPLTWAESLQFAAYGACAPADARDVPPYTPRGRALTSSAATAATRPAHPLQSASTASRNS